MLRTGGLGISRDQRLQGEFAIFKLRVVMAFDVQFLDPSLDVCLVPMHLVIVPVHNGNSISTSVIVIVIVIVTVKLPLACAFLGVAVSPTNLNSVTRAGLNIFRKGLGFRESSLPFSRHTPYKAITNFYRAPNLIA